MALQLFNTLSGKVEEFRPAEDNLVRMYACGLTVYDYGHIGNFRTFIAVDVLRRFLEQSGYQLRHVMNITDVDDKIIRNAMQRGMPIAQYTEKYTQAFLDDMATLSLESPEKIVRATDHIGDMAHFIAELVKGNHAYRTDEGSYYFRISSFPQYGKLSKKDFAGMTDGARVDVDEYDKDNARDFALWKAPKPGEQSWETEIGPGRPGWHIECSTMSMKYLGESFDIHLGGEDLVFPHHENEIAQSEALTGREFAHYWVHARFLLVEGEKMSKSLGNFYTLRDLVLMGHKPSAIRFLLISVPYRKQLNFTFDGLRQAANAVDRLRNFKRRLETEHLAEGASAETARATEARTAMRAAMDDDLNTAQMLGVVFDLVRDVNAAADRGELRRGDVPPILAALEDFDRIFAVLPDNDAEKVQRVIKWAEAEGLQDKITPEARELAQAAALSDAQVEERVAQHLAARKAKDFKSSDAIRNELAAQGVILENTKDGVRWRRK